MNWHLKPFSELTPRQLFEIYKNRVDVFVVEQNCPYHEVDDKDLHALHLFAEQEGKLAAYCRILAEADGVRIGRVLTAAHARGSGIGRELMTRALGEIEQRFAGQNVNIQAQSYLLGFYRSFGFQTASAEYLEDGIPHHDMVRHAV